VTGPHVRRWLRALTALLVFSCVLGAGIAFVATLGASGPTSQSPASTLRLFFVGVVAIYLVIGTLIIERRPGNRVGPIVYLIGCVVASYALVDAWLVQPDPFGGALLAWTIGLVDGPMYFLVAILFLSFPDGRLPSPRWRPVVAIDAVLAALVMARGAFLPGPGTYYPRFDNPFGWAGMPVAIFDVAYMLMLVIVGLAGLSLISRWRRAGAVERAQLKWAALAAVALGVIMLAYGVLIGPGAYSAVLDALVGLGFGFFAVAIGIAILRYHLFEIDRIVSRTIAYALITATLVATYVVVIVVVAGPLGSLTGGDTIAVAVTTLVVAALFQPLRRRVQTVVDRRFDRARFDAERTSIAFAARLRDEVDIAMVTGDLERTVREAMRPASMALWLRVATR